jgi:predicted alpha/beta-hydrolase family hydrolase
VTHAQITTRHGDLSVVIDGPARPSELLVLGHGAGASMTTDYMAFFARALASSNRAVARFNFPYMEAGRKSPGSQAVSEESFADVVEHLRGELSPAKMFLGGKSYGGRIASHVVAAGTQCDGLVFLGYPLHAPGRPDRIRADHFKDVSCPMLFVEGTRDPFCPLETLATVRRKIKTPTDLLVIDDGDHSLKVRKSSGRSTQEAWSEAVAGISEWLADRH